MSVMVQRLTLVYADGVKVIAPFRFNTNDGTPFPVTSILIEEERMMRRWPVRTTPPK